MSMARKERPEFIQWETEISYSGNKYMSATWSINLDWPKRQEIQLPSEDGKIGQSGHPPSAILVDLIVRHNGYKQIHFHQVVHISESNLQIVQWPANYIDHQLSKNLVCAWIEAKERNNHFHFQKPFQTRQLHSQKGFWQSLPTAVMIQKNQVLLQAAHNVSISNSTNPFYLQCDFTDQYRQTFVSTSTRLWSSDMALGSSTTRTLRREIENSVAGSAEFTNCFRCPLAWKMSKGHSWILNRGQNEHTIPPSIYKFSHMNIVLCKIQQSTLN